jgi:transcriptional regulator with XRE-family HTH domain
LKKNDFSLLGIVLKEIREHRGLEQAQLCKDICSQAQLSKIENGLSIPKSTTLYLLAKKLCVDLNLIFEMTSNERIEYVFEYKQLVRGLIRQKKYVEVYNLVKTEEDSPVFQKNIFNKQFILWHKGICLFELNINKYKALRSLIDALELTHFSDDYFTKEELEIMNSIGIIYFENQDYYKAIKIHQKAIAFLKKDFITNNTYQITIRIQYNYAKALTRLKKYNDSISMCNEALKVCEKIETLYLLGELTYHIGYNHYLKEELENAKRYFDKAIQIFKITNKPDYIIHINNLLNIKGI